MIRVQVGQEDRIRHASLCEALVRAASNIEQQRLAARLNHDVGTESIDFRNGRSGTKKSDHDLLTGNLLRCQAREQRNRHQD